MSDPVPETSTQIHPQLYPAPPPVVVVQPSEPRSVRFRDRNSVRSASRSLSPARHRASHRADYDTHTISYEGTRHSHGGYGDSYMNHAYSPMPPVIMPPGIIPRSRSRSHRSHSRSRTYSPIPQPIVIPAPRSRSRSRSMSPVDYSRSRRQRRSRSSSETPPGRHGYPYSHEPPIQIPTYAEPYSESRQQPHGMATMQPAMYGGNGYEAVNPYQASISYSMRRSDGSTSSLVPQPGYKTDLEVPPLTSYIYAFLTDTIPRQIYLHLLLRLPGLYFSRVSRIFADAQISFPVIQKMVAETDIAVQDIARHFPSQAYDVYSPISNLRNSWESFIDSVLREWKTFNVVSVLLLSAILTILQINSAAADPITRFSALVSLICALMSLLYGGVYIIAFGRMKRTYKAALWAEEAQKSKTSILWNVWVLLAMPAVWLSWSLISCLVCIMAFVWRTGTIQELEIPVMSSKTALPPRIVISGILAIGLIYFSLALDTFRRYGDVMDREWQARVNQWRSAPQGNHPVLLPTQAPWAYHPPIYVTRSSSRSPSRSPPSPGNSRNRRPRSPIIIQKSPSRSRSYSPIHVPRPRSTSYPPIVIEHGREPPSPPHFSSFPPLLIIPPSGSSPPPHAGNHGYVHADQSDQNQPWPPPSHIIQSPQPIKRGGFAFISPEPSTNPEARPAGPPFSSNSFMSNPPPHSPPGLQPSVTPSRHGEEIQPNAPFVPIRVGRLDAGSAAWCFYDHPDLFLPNDISLDESERHIKWQQFTDEILAAWTGDHPLLRGTRGDEFKDSLNGGVCLPKDALCHILEDWDEWFFKRRHLHPFICEEYSSDSSAAHTLWIYLLKDPANASAHTLASEDVVEAGGDMTVHHLIWIAPREYLASRKARNQALLSIHVDFIRP